MSDATASEVDWGKANKALLLNTLAFTVCFAVWMINGVLVTFLATNQVYEWGAVEIGWLMGIPVLTGSLFRLPAGILTDRYGGRPVYGALLLFCALPLYLLSYADSFLGFALCSAGFGMAGVSFSIGIAYTSVWYPRERQGTALGIFGAGNTGAALTTLFAPTILNTLTDNGANIEGWRQLPLYYAGLMIVMGVVFLLFSENRKPEVVATSFAKALRPLKSIRVWRFGLYYFLVFGCFVAFSQWLVPYFISVYYLPLVTAGILAGMFSLPSGVVRALGGWMSDRWGARAVMYWVLGLSVAISFMLVIPKMEILSPGEGVMAIAAGTVTKVTETEVQVAGRTYSLTRNDLSYRGLDERILVFPRKHVWQEPVVEAGQEVEKNDLLAKGVTRIYFQANVWIFAGFVVALGAVWGVGMAAVFKHVAHYFPNDVGAVGGMVGVIGGLGGFFSPILFGYLLDLTGLWTSCWMFIWVLSCVCLFWMHNVIQHTTQRETPEIQARI